MGLVRLLCAQLMPCIIGDRQVGDHMVPTGLISEVRYAHGHEYDYNEAWWGVPSGYAPETRVDRTHSPLQWQAEERH